MNDVLRRLGYSGVTAGDGRVGIEILRALKDQIAVVLLDTTMPGTSSEETLRELQEIKTDVAVVLFCEFSEAEGLRRSTGRCQTDRMRSAPVGRAAAAGSA